MVVPVPAPVDGDRALVAEATRAVLAESLPEELGVFDAAADDFLDGRTPAGARDEALGFGAEAAVLLTPYVVAAVGATVRYLAAFFLETARAEAQPVVASWVRRVLRLRPAVPPPPDEPSPPALTPAVIAQVRDITRAVCEQMGLDPDDAGLVSDAVTGRLALAGA